MPFIALDNVLVSYHLIYNKSNADILDKHVNQNFFDVFRNDGVFLLPFIRAGFYILVCVVMIAMIVATPGYFRKNKWP